MKKHLTRIPWLLALLLGFLLAGLDHPAEGRAERETTSSRPALHTPPVLPVADTFCFRQCGGALHCTEFEDRCCWEGPNSCGDSVNCSHFCGFFDGPGGF